MQEPKSDLKLWVEEIPRIAFVTALVGTVGGFCLTLGGWMFFTLLTLVFSL